MAGAAFKYVPQTAVTIRPLPSILYKSFLNGMEISMLLTAGDNHRERERDVMAARKQMQKSQSMEERDVYSINKSSVLKNEV